MPRLQQWWIDVRGSLWFVPGQIVLGASRITVRSTAVSGVGLVLMGTAAGFLLVWWSRTIIRERRARHRPPAHARQDQ